MTDGGENGLECTTSLVGSRDETRWETKCPWDKIPEKTIVYFKQDPIKLRTRSFEDLEELVIDGLNYHWGRNKNHIVAKNVKIIEEFYEIFMNAMNMKEKAIDDVTLIYNTNEDWLRSGNPGTLTMNPVSWIGNMISREAICYNVGYIKYSNGWGYSYDNKEDLNFKDTAAHELGHEILKSYGGTEYSYGHKESSEVYSLDQHTKSNAPQFPISGEIDLMPYYKDNILGDEHRQPNYFLRRAAAEKDVLSLLWLTKIKIL